MQRCADDIADDVVDDVRTTCGRHADDICHLCTVSCLISHQISLQTTLRMTYVIRMSSAYPCSLTASNSVKNSDPLSFTFKEQTPLLKINNLW